MQFLRAEILISLSALSMFGGVRDQIDAKKVLFQSFRRWSLQVQDDAASDLAGSLQSDTTVAEAGVQVLGKTTYNNLVVDLARVRWAGQGVLSRRAQQLNLESLMDTLGVRRMIISLPKGPSWDWTGRD